MAGEKHLEQANLDAVVLLRELEAAKAEINRSFLSRCDAVLFQWWVARWCSPRAVQSDCWWRCRCRRYRSRSLQLMPPPHQ